MTKEIFRENAYLKEHEARVTVASDRGIELDETIFYPTAGGQPGDHGEFVLQDGSKLNIIDTRYDRETGVLLHVPEEGSALPVVGEQITMHLDWQRRYQLMRLHSLMHMLCAVVPETVTGGAIREDGTARLDFDIPEPPDKQKINDDLNKTIDEDHPLKISRISDEEMQQKQDLIRTMSVKPPMGKGSVRLIEFKGADLQPCGGTHVNSTAEIGPVEIQSIKKKGKLNRRITVRLLEP